MQKTWVWSLDWEDPLEKEMATHSSILACRIPWAEEPGGLQSMESQKVRYDWVTNTFHKQERGEEGEGYIEDLSGLWGERVGTKMSKIKPVVLNKERGASYEPWLSYVAEEALLLTYGKALRKTMSSIRLGFFVHESEKPGQKCLVGHLICYPGGQKGTSLDTFWEERTMNPYLCQR